MQYQNRTVYTWTVLVPGAPLENTVVKMLFATTNYNKGNTSQTIAAPKDKNGTVKNETV